MRINFRATAGTFEDEDEVLVLGVATDEDWDQDEENGHALQFQRPSEVSTKPLQDWEEDGIYLEYNDQIYAEYGIVGRCRMSRERLSVDLSGRFDGMEEVEGFDVDLAVDDETYEQLRAGLPRIFHGLTERLTLAE